MVQSTLGNVKGGFLASLGMTGAGVGVKNPRVALRKH